MTYTVPDTASAFGIQHRFARCENRTKQFVVARVKSAMPLRFPKMRAMTLL